MPRNWGFVEVKPPIEVWVQGVKIWRKDGTPMDFHEFVKKDRPMEVHGMAPRMPVMYVASRSIGTSNVTFRTPFPIRVDPSLKPGEWRIEPGIPKPLEPCPHPKQKYTVNGG